MKTKRIYVTFCLEIPEDEWVVDTIASIDYKFWNTNIISHEITDVKDSQGVRICRVEENVVYEL
jgi:hypothetical protein